MSEKEFTYFHAKVDFETLDEKLKRFVTLRNELVMLAQEIGFEVKSGILELNAIAPNAIAVQRVQCDDSVTVVNGHSNLKVTQGEIEMKVQ
ncbi:MAG: hypothetical protein MSS60_00260 [Clostridiales bacterium]|nr:hypothetical protein [Clostridiales bacterium]